MTSALMSRLRKIEAAIQPHGRWFTVEVEYGDHAAIEREAERLRRDEGFRDDVDMLIIGWRWTRETLPAARAALAAKAAQHD